MSPSRLLEDKSLDQMRNAIIRENRDDNQGHKKCNLTKKKL
jgi:hypothetical protein